MRALLIIFVLLPSFLWGQPVSWLDGSRTRISQGFGSYFPTPLWGPGLSVERWQPTDHRDIHWALGLEVAYLEQEESAIPPSYQPGDRRFEQCLKMSFTYTPSVTLFYVHKAGHDMAGRARIEVPIGISALFGGGEKLVRITPIIRNGQWVEDRWVWHRDSPFLLRPNLGLYFSYVHRISKKWALGWRSGYEGIPGLGGSISARIFVEIKQ